MRLFPQCGVENVDSSAVCWISGASADGTQYPATWSEPDRSSPKARAAWLPKAVGVPRRFAVGKLMAITTLYAAVFALLSSVGAHPLVFLSVAIFVTGIGLAQALLFGGTKPRMASILAGAVLGFTMSCTALCLVVGLRPQLGWRDPWILFEFFMCFVLGAPMGALWGYLVGGLIGGLL